MLVLALVGRMPRRYAGLSASLFGLFILQSVFVALRESMPAVAALHPLNGFLILAVGALTTYWSWQDPGRVDRTRRCLCVALPLRHIACGRHLLDERRPPGRRLERIGEVFGDVANLAALELGDPDVADRHAVAVIDRALDNDKVA